jgi:DNA-binding NtrC family response regulator
VDNKTGRFEAAHTGTIFLDEISSMSPKLQVKLLRVLQEREFERVGESRTIRVDVRVIAATNQYLEDEVEAGRFRDDLYYRLNVVPIYLPPLRERKDDIPLLAEFFLKRYTQIDRRPVRGFTPGAMKILGEYDWPGNVRELEHDVERAVVLCQGDLLTDEILAKQVRNERRLRRLRARRPDLAGLVQQLVQVGLETYTGPDSKVHERLVKSVEKELIEQVLLECDRIQVKAAARLGINRNTLHKKVQELGLDPAETDAAPPPGDSRP